MTTNPNPADQLWTHQAVSLDQARAKFGYGSRCVMIQLPTGTGKTKMVVSGINGAISKPSPADNSRRQSVAFVVPRRELLWQSGAELKQWGINHKIVKKLDDPKSFDVHVWCRDTFIRRVRSDQLQQWPDLIIVDEAHLGLKQWLEIKAAAPPHTKFLGVTATPERLDRGDLSKMWDVLIEGDQLAWFVGNKFLKAPHLIGIPKIDGIDDLDRNAAGDVSAKELLELRKAKAKGSFIYGDEIEHYKKYAPGQAFLNFHRSLIDAEQAAEEFTAAGFPVESIDGTMSDTKRKEKIDKVKSGVLLGLTTVDLCTYGLDVPNISCLIMSRPTDSLALLFQMIGRGLRWDGIYLICTILDLVGNCDYKKHGHPLEPRQWNWTGVKRKKPPENAEERIAAVGKCPVCFDILINGVCRSCGAVKPVKQRKPLKKLDGFLVPIEGPELLENFDPEFQREFQDRINSAISRYRTDWYKSDTGPGGAINTQAVSDLIDIAYELKWKNPPVQVYKRLVPHADMTVNTALLTEIAKIKEYDLRWIKLQREFFELGLASRLARKDRMTG